ncbi:hypothetical protein [Campylobacter sp. RM12651]|uniref:hypothetical protein n=1 Tax=Campylobacter sp. RM12651 TaxID=1660079 RepID=UPI001EFAED35|nr:hypothetical protein [Campylobacter sp. RM12651]ULO04583.1 hypothetical protein AVBRAN_a0101 [Campylobacter sp. RM12651]
MIAFDKKFMTIGLDSDIAVLIKLVNAKDKNILINKGLANAFIEKENELLANLEDKTIKGAFAEKMSIIKERYSYKADLKKIPKRNDKQISKDQSIKTKEIEEIEEDDFD